MTQKKIIVANWKMNPESIAEAKKLFITVKRSAKKYRKSSIVICPPSLYIQTLLSFPRGGVSVGAQNVFWEPNGSFTGEISAVQLAKEKVDYCIVGHSERRELGETNEQVNKKVSALLKVGITPIVCIGEKERDHDAFYLAHIKDQIKEALSGVKQKDISNILIAYEPIWAIGSKAKGAIQPEELHQMTIYIRKVLSDLYSQRIAFNVPILYGGSVDQSNAEDIMKRGEAQGLLIGRASLDARVFTDIITIVNSVA